MLRSLGLSYRGFVEQGIMMPVLELQSKFIKPARYDDQITVRTILKELPGARIHFDYELYNQEGQLINTGNTRLVFIDMRSNRPCKPPADFMDLLEPYFRAPRYTRAAMDRSEEHTSELKSLMRN